MYLVLEQTREEKHLQYVSGVGPIRYWLTAYLWDMLVFLLPIGLILLIAYAMQSAVYSTPDNMLALFLMLLAYA